MFRVLSNDEVLYCIKIGNERQDTNTKNKVASKQFTNRDPATIHIQGVMGEFAFAKMCDQHFGESKAQDVTKVLNDTKSRGARHDTFDWTLFGKRIDVKTTLNAKSTTVYARLHKRVNPADFYVLILVEFLNPTTGGAMEIWPRQYDQMFGLMRHAAETKGTLPFGVRCTFQGFQSSKELFAHYNSGNGGSNAASSFCCQVNPSWDNFIRASNQDLSLQFSSQTTNQKEQTERQIGNST